MDFGKKVVELDVNDILPNRFQPRIKFNEDSINELCDSIREHGIIQPIVVRKMGDKFEIIAGERRFKASLLVGKNSIPAIVTELNDKDSAEVALIENVQRRDLTPIEEAISYKKILDMGYLTQEDLANKLGKTQSTVANKLRLLNLTENVQEALLEGKISERHARSLLKIINPAQQREMLEKIINNRLTVRKTEEQISKLLKGEDIFAEQVINEKPEVEIPKIDTIVETNNINNDDNLFNNNDIKDNKDNNIINPNLNIKNFEDMPIQNDYNNNNFINPMNNYFESNDNQEDNEFNQFVPMDNDLTDSNYKSNMEEVVPTFEENNNNIIPKIPSFDTNKSEEPVVIIEEEPTMNNNNFINPNNVQNNNVNQNNILNNNEFNNVVNEEKNENKEFNPFDMMNNIPQNEFNIPSAGIEDSPKMSNDTSFETIKNNYNNNYSVEEPTIIAPEADNSNPGFMDIDKIKNEAIDINSILNKKEVDNNSSFVEPSDNVNPFSNLLKNIKPEEPILKPNEKTIEEKEEEPELKPGKFFELPFEEEEPDKNIEAEMPNDPFNFNINGDLSNMKLNTEGHPQFKSLDEVSQFKEEPKNNISSMMNQNPIHNDFENPVNQFGIPSQDEFNNFNYDKNIEVKPTLTQIPPMEQSSMPSYIGNNMMTSQIPSNKNINLAMDAIKDCVNKIKGLGFNINTEDFDFENMYQIMFRIEK